MSTTKVLKSTSLRNTGRYAVYGDAASEKAGFTRSEYVTFSDGGEYDSFMRNSLTDLQDKNRRTQCLHIIQSWHPKELDKNNPQDLAKAHFAGTQLAKSLAPDSKFLVATHTDSKAGHVHNHLVIVNDEQTTGLAPRVARNWHAVKKVNDTLMDDLQMEVCQPSKNVETNYDYWARLHREKTGTKPTKTLRDQWKNFIKQEYLLLLDDPRLAACDTTDDAVEKMTEIAGEYHLSVLIKQPKSRGRQPGIGLALVDEAGEIAKYHGIGKNGGVVWKDCKLRASTFGRDFRFDALKSVLEEKITTRKREEELQAAQNRVVQDVGKFNLRRFGETAPRTRGDDEFSIDF